MKLTETLINNVKFLLKAKGISQKDFCTQAQISYSYFNGTLNNDPGANPTLKIVENIAKTLNVSIAEILSDQLIDNYSRNEYVFGYIKKDFTSIFQKLVNESEIKETNVEGK